MDAASGFIGAPTIAPTPALATSNPPPGQLAASRRSPSGDRQTLPMHTKRTGMRSSGLRAGAGGKHPRPVGHPITIDSARRPRRPSPNPRYLSVSVPALAGRACDGPKATDAHDPEVPLRPAQRRDRRARRPRQDHPRGRDALAGRRVRRAPARRRARDGLRRPRAREGDHDPRQEHRDQVRRQGDTASR